MLLGYVSVSSWSIFPAISAYEDSEIRLQAGVYQGMENVLEAFTKHSFTNEYLPQEEHMDYIYSEQGTKKTRHVRSTNVC